MIRPSKKITIVIASSVAAVTLGGVAFAYWSGGGTGTGTGATGTTTPVVINQTSTVAGVGPGTGTQPLSGTFTTTKPTYVDQVTAAVASTTNAGCTSDDFTIVQPTATGAEVNSGDSWGGGSIAFNDTSANQDACKGVTIHLAYTSN